MSNVRGIDLVSVAGNFSSREPIVKATPAPSVFRISERGRNQLEVQVVCEEDLPLCPRSTDDKAILAESRRE